MTETTDRSTTAISKAQLDILMHGRRSLYPKQFTGERIDDEVVRQLLEYAHTAPNHKKTYPWRFIVYSDRAMHDLIDFWKDYYVKHTPASEVSEKKLQAFEERKQKTSHILAIIMHRDEQKRLPEMEEMAAVSCAVENIYLALNTFGLGGYWSTGKIMFSEEARAYLNVTGEDIFMGFFLLGKVKMDLPPASRDSVESHVIWKK